MTQSNRVKIYRRNTDHMLITFRYLENIQILAITERAELIFCWKSLELRRHMGTLGSSSEQNADLGLEQRL